jgi:hypothetical protein
MAAYRCKASEGAAAAAAEEGEEEEEEEMGGREEEVAGCSGCRRVAVEALGGCSCSEAAPRGARGCCWRWHWRGHGRRLDKGGWGALAPGRCYALHAAVVAPGVLKVGRARGLCCCCCAASAEGVLASRSCLRPQHLHLRLQGSSALLALLLLLLVAHQRETHTDLYIQVPETPVII